MYKSQWSINDKYSIVLESLKADTSIQAICNKYGIGQATGGLFFLRLFVGEFTLSTMVASFLFMT